MQRVIHLHPSTNSGEAALAVVKFDEDRVMNLKLNLTAYGNHCSVININFDKPQDMIALSDGLREVAEEARRVLDG